MSTPQKSETLKARIRGYGCEYTPGVLTVTDRGHNWVNGTLVGTLIVQLEFTKSIRQIQNVPNVEGEKYGQGEEPTVHEIQELMARLAVAYPLLEELDVDRITVYHELKDKDGKVTKKWQHVYLKISPEQSARPLRVSLSDLVNRVVPDNTEETLTPSKKIRPGGKKARKAALQEGTKS